MNDFMLMEPSNHSFQELFSNGVKYTVPRFQRDYAWELEQWEDLWADIETLEKEHYHYMGYIMLQKKGQHEFKVIDGQQRLVTLSLVIVSAMKQIQAFINNKRDTEENQKRLDVFYDRLIGALNPVSLKVDNKLSLNRNNKRHFKDICSNMDAPILRGMTITNLKLNDAFNFFASKSMGNSGKSIAQFVERLTNGMMFTRIVVQDSLNAYKVFETLNARGVRLSTPDLLKNYIFSVISKNDDVSDERLDELDEDWSAILAQLGETDFTDFVRYHHNLQKQMVTKQDIFKSIRNLYTEAKEAYAYLNSLKEYVSIYASLLNPYDEWWKNKNNKNNAHHKISHYLQGLKLFAIKQPFPVLMVACKMFSHEEFLKTLKYLYILSIRYNVVCQLSPNELDKAYNQIAVKIFNGEYIRASHIKNSEEFRRLYPDDKVFRNAFEFYKMPSRRESKKIRFLLTEIEKSFGRELNYLDTSLEHVCPYNPEQNWYEAFGEGVHTITNRLGNMVLLEKDELRRADFNTKKKAYSKTAFRLAKKVAEYESWELSTLNHYQNWLAEQAVNTWSVR